MVPEFGLGISHFHIIVLFCWQGTMAVLSYSFDIKDVSFLKKTCDLSCKAIYLILILCFVEKERQNVAVLGPVKTDRFYDNTNCLFFK